MIYLYRCTVCGVTTEVRVDMGEQPDEIACGRCGEVARRFFTFPAVIYKGESWSGPGHGVPDMDERAKMPGPLEFDDLLEE